MIKLGMRQDGKATIVLGLSRLNCERLLSGQPILIDMEALGAGQGHIMLLAGETEDDITEDLRAIGLIPNEVLREAQANGGTYRGEHFLRPPRPNDPEQSRDR
jgi:hypothetical protein